MSALVKHVRVFNGQNFVPVATIVAISKDCIGVAVCNPKDHFNKAIGTKIALGRANTGSNVFAPNRIVSNGTKFIHIAKLLKLEMKSMKRRAKKYFQS